MASERATDAQVAFKLQVQVALVFLAVQLSGALLAAVLQRPLLRLCARLAPPAPEESLSRPRYLYDQALEDAATALDFAEREEEELLARLPGLLPAEGVAAPPLQEAVVVLNANLRLAQEIDRFLEELLQRGADQESIDPLDRALLREMTGDRAELMEGVRRDLLRHRGALDQRHRDSLFTATSLFERLVWLVGRYAAQIPEPLARQDRAAQ